MLGSEKTNASYVGGMVMTHDQMSGMIMTHDGGMVMTHMIMGATTHNSLHLLYSDASLN